MDSNTATLGASLVTLATLLVHTYTQWRNRKWDLEDKKSELENTNAHRNEVRNELKTNTDLTILAGVKADAAYTEANDVNRKIEQIGERIADKQ